MTTNTNQITITPTTKATLATLRGQRSSSKSQAKILRARLALYWMMKRRGITMMETDTYKKGEILCQTICVIN